MKALRLAPPLRRQSGFTLVEILVGLVIAMIGTVIMMEVLLTSDQRTRTSTAGNEALSSGAVMLHLMQRDLVQAGFGLTSNALLNNCSVALPTGATVPLAPVVINPPTSLVPAADANTDRLLVFYSSDSGQPEGQEVVAVSGSSYTLRSPSAFAVGDYVLASPNVCSGTLTLARVTALGAATVTVDTANTAATSIFNLGRVPRIVAYAVRNGSLTSCDFMLSDCRVANAANWTAVGANIVSLRAQYGRDTAPAGAMDGVDLWDQTIPASACQWARTPAVRFVLVARSSQYETKIDETTRQRVCDTVTAATPLWAGSTGGSTAPVDLSAASDWQCYRYKTFETVAPARNTAWIRVPSGC
ncbi:MAG TPA: PilW family protein [Ramlibacter sp.]|uniref:PilW family protein n=1 Tax=Ramlibacter sp. TaxID=1917967 RepID=UPI002D7E36ED|nr:PilW family protein [Ramlibacter sp.]HET8748005.1 PilW family protein [Ramlibacter sp.]